MIIDAPEYFFAVVQQPDIVNTALLNGAAVSKTIRYFALNSSVSTRRESIAEEIPSPTSVGTSCTTQAPSNVIVLSGIYVDNSEFGPWGQGQPLEL